MTRVGRGKPLSYRRCERDSILVASGLAPPVPRGLWARLGRGEPLPYGIAALLAVMDARCFRGLRSPGRGRPRMTKEGDWG